MLTIVKQQGRSLNSEDPAATAPSLDYTPALQRNNFSSCLSDYYFGSVISQTNCLIDHSIFRTILKGKCYYLHLTNEEVFKNLPSFHDQKGHNTLEGARR